MWDDELARIAQRWADQCMPGHDHRRNVGKWSRCRRAELYSVYPDRFAVGQNVATTWTFQRMPHNNDSPEFKRHIRGWFDEVFVRTLWYRQYPV